MALWQAWTDLLQGISGIALYWITSNLFGTLQTLALRRVLTARAGGSLA
jgi:membrane protein insertase Oxa1/YidC/SpoIIIJ